MIASRELSEVESLMIGFGERTGLTNSARPPQRYLWTDAYAVGNFLVLCEVTGERRWLSLATKLIDQVHAVLGRHRPDDSRTGWISGLGEQEGRRHPTAGGLRIGKPLPERAPGEPMDQHEEWDRDGQYFHYLTRWMQALARAAVATADVRYLRWAIELAIAAQAAFAYRGDDGVYRMVWKTSIDLSRPLVASMGQHDPLDALLSYCELEQLSRLRFARTGLPDLAAQIDTAATICAGRSWVTDDPLGLGGLLVDAYRAARLFQPGESTPVPAPARLLADTRRGLARFAGTRLLQARAEERLAFRELGLAIGLHAIERLRHQASVGAIPLAAAAVSEIDGLARIAGLAQQIETFWRQPAHQAVTSWREHPDINAVMLATSLLADRFFN